MSKEKQNRRVNHIKRIYSYRNLDRLGPANMGSIVRFRYIDAETFDNWPLCVFLYREFGSKNLIHTLNLNYLYEYQVQKLFKVVSTRSSFNLIHASKKETDDKRHWLIENIGLYGKGLQSAKRFYQNVLLPKLPDLVQESYRTYKVSKVNMGSLQTIYYKVDKSGVKVI